MATPQLAITHIAESQNNKEVTANDAFDLLDNSDNAEVSFANTNTDMTLTQQELASGGAIKITGAITADRHVNLPVGVGRSFIFLNSTTGGHSLILQVTGAPGATVSISAALGLVEIYSDGTNVFALTGGSGGVFAAGGDLSGTPTSQTVIGLEGVPLDATTVGTPSNGQVIAYDSGSSKYKAQSLTAVLPATPVEAEPVSFSGTSGTLAHTPSVVSGFTKVKLYRNGMRLAEGGGKDWTRSGAVITLNVAAGGSDYFEADYWQ